MVTLATFFDQLHYTLSAIKDVTTNIKENDWIYAEDILIRSGEYLRNTTILRHPLAEEFTSQKAYIWALNLESEFLKSVRPGRQLVYYVRDR